MVRSLSNHARPMYCIFHTITLTNLFYCWYIIVSALFFHREGHGKHGEKASKLASDYFQKNLRAHLSQGKHVSMREHEKTMRNIFEGAHKRILAEYEVLTTLDYDGFTFNLMMTTDRVDFYSSPECPYVLLQDFGTTAVVCIYWEETQKLMVANCGDSDALIGRWDGATQQIQPNLLAISDNVSCTSNGEQDRIRREFGRKTKFGGGYLSPNDTTYGFHSLAMTRALGHKFLEKYGVTWDPHVRFFQITLEDVVLVVASDGLFDVVNSKAVLSMAAERHTVDGSLRTLTPIESSERLVELALNNWKKQFNTMDVADNTTVCVLKLSDAFDSIVPQRDELSNSGTSFSPALTIFHAIEAEIEETSKDILSTPLDSGSDPSTPIGDAAPKPIVMVDDMLDSEPNDLQPINFLIPVHQPPQEGVQPIVPTDEFPLLTTGTSASNSIKEASVH
jgi:serine/threonine protein phosphatase PrpC